MMSVLEHCLWQKWSAADKAFVGFLGELFLQTFCLKDKLRMQNIAVYYCPSDYDQQFAAVDWVCCRKVSFFKMAMHRFVIGSLDS